MNHFWNETNKISTTTCLTESASGTFCSVSTTEQMIVHNWMDAVYLYSKFLVGFIILFGVIYLFRRRRA